MPNPDDDNNNLWEAIQRMGDRLRQELTYQRPPLPAPTYPEYVRGDFVEDISEQMRRQRRNRRIDALVRERRGETFTLVAPPEIHERLQSIDWGFSSPPQTHSWETIENPQPVRDLPFCRGADFVVSSRSSCSPTANPKKKSCYEKLDSATDCHERAEEIIRLMREGKL